MLSLSFLPFSYTTLFFPPAFFHFFFFFPNFWKIYLIITLLLLLLFLFKTLIPFIRTPSTNKCNILLNAVRTQNGFYRILWDFIGFYRILWVLSFRLLKDVFFERRVCLRTATTFFFKGREKEKRWGGDVGGVCGWLFWCLFP